MNFAVKGSEAIAFLDAQGVPIRLEASIGSERRPAEVGAIAHPATVSVQCFR